MVVKTLQVTAVVGTCLWPVVASADDFDLDGPQQPTESSKPVLTNEMSVGVGYQNQSSAKYGQYSGATEEGFISRGNFDLRYRDTKKEDGTFYYRAWGQDIDVLSNTLLPSSSVGLRMGEQGSWDARLSYDGLSWQKTDSFHTLFDKDGKLVNGLTAGSVSTTASNAAGVARVNKYLTTMGIGTQRDKFAGQFSWNALDHWKVGSKVEHENKEGTKINAMMFINNNAFASFAEPIDYDTDRYTLSAAYTTRPFQAQVSYTFSNFTNNDTEYTAENPFTGTTRSGYSQSQYSLPPGNSEHAVKATAGLNLTDTTRIATNLRYGLQLQNDTYYARYYENPASRVSGTSYDGQIENLYGNIALTSRPFSDWNFKAAYTVDSRDNDSSLATVRSYRGDTGTASWNTMTTVPYSFINQTADFDVGYKVSKDTKLSLDYTYKDKLRSRSVSSRNQESVVGGKVQSRLMESVNSSLGYSRSVRQATSYDGNSGWKEMGRNVSNESLLGLYSYAARNRDEIRANVNWNAGSRFSLGLTGRYTQDQYPDGYYGITDDRMITVGPDVTFAPSQDVTTHFYYNYQQIYSDMKMNSQSGTSGVDWRLENEDSVHTVGMRGDWQVNDKVKLMAQNNLSYGNTAFEEASWLRSSATGATLLQRTAADLPTVKQLTNTLELTGEYQVDETMTIALSGVWERYIGNDYLDSETAASVSNATSTVVTGGTGDESYDVGAVMLTTRFKW